MLLQGRVVKLDARDQSGLIKTDNGIEYIFTRWNCEGEKLPKLNSAVLFEKDDDFKTIDVAINVVPEAA